MLQDVANADPRKTKLLAERLHVTEQDVVEMDQRLGPDEVSLFFAQGMLMNVISQTHLGDPPDPWAVRLLEGCGKA